MSAACFRCQPRTVRRHHLAASLLDCGQPGCTGKPRPVVDKPTRLYTPPKDGGA